jgi:glycosyltransferase involved in cell wall biosynthesis
MNPVRPHTKLLIALPVMDEIQSLPLVLDAIARQSFRDFSLIACVNQPDSWWLREDKAGVCKSNAAALDLLEKFDAFPVTVIDRSSRGKGWSEKKYGVGWARKTVLDHASSVSPPTAILLSFDADTFVQPEYLESIVENFREHPQMNTLSVPYFHNLTGNDSLDRSVLRYELYMRYYAVNLWRICSPHAFAALGSAIAVKNSAYQAVRGISPRLSGEDFYFLQKMIKYGGCGHWNREWVYPASRTSDRVFFGTGPAVIKGLEGNWDSYPFYKEEWFDEVGASFAEFPRLFKEDVETPMSSFLATVLGDAIWEPLRRNFITEKTFVKACCDRIDGLRILQYLKWRHRSDAADENLGRVSDFVCRHFPGYAGQLPELKPCYAENSVQALHKFRLVLTEIESSYRKRAGVV